MALGATPEIELTSNLNIKTDFYNFERSKLSVLNMEQAILR